MKTIFSGASAVIPSRHSERAGAMSSRACSAATTVFVRVIPWRTSSGATLIAEVSTPASASRDTISRRNRSGLFSSQPGISGAWASNGSNRRSPPIGNASACPCLRHVAAHLTAVAREIRIRRPAALVDMPSSRAATNRPRKSQEYGFSIHAHPLYGSQYESEIRPDGTPKGPSWLWHTLGSGGRKQHAHHCTPYSSVNAARFRSPARLRWTRDSPRSAIARHSAY